MKVLWYGDFLRASGFGNVSEEIISRLMDRHDFTVFAVNYFGDPYNMPESPYYRFRDVPVYPASDAYDVYGRKRLLELLQREDFDALFVLQDPFNMVPIHDHLRMICKAKSIPYIFYFPVDGDLDKLWVDRGVLTANFPVTYTNYGLAQVEKHTDKGVSVIYHGVDTETFFPISEEEKLAFRADHMGAAPEDFIITNVNRNQPRKNLPRTIMAWVEIKKRIPEAKLYLHMNLGSDGYNLTDFVRRYVPEEFHDDIKSSATTGDGLSKSQMRALYGASDIIVSTTLGEGWGLSITEAMACKTPVVMPRHTSCVEIIGEDEERGYLVECTDAIVLPKSDNDLLRPLVNIHDFVNTVCQVHDRPDEAVIKVEAAYEWVQHHCDWDEIAAQWDELLRVAIQG